MQRLFKQTLNKQNRNNLKIIHFIARFIVFESHTVYAKPVKDITFHKTMGHLNNNLAGCVKN